MKNKLPQAYGTWTSPISAELIAGNTLKLGQCQVKSGVFYWLETRPKEAGRTVLVACPANGTACDITPPQFSVRSRVHEYGGGAFAVTNDKIFFVNNEDQQIYWQTEKQEPVRLTNETSTRFADLHFDTQHNTLLAVAEEHQEQTAGIEPLNYLVRITPDQGVEPLIYGSDFFAAPRVSPDGKLLCWISWNHPDMPWDSSSLWLANLGSDGIPTNIRQIAGGINESVMQPEWAADNSLFFISDKSGWWNIYCLPPGLLEPDCLCPCKSEFGSPLWNFAQSSYAVINKEQLLVSFTSEGIWKLGIIDLKEPSLTEIPCPYQEISFLASDGDQAIMRVGSPQTPLQFASLDLKEGRSRNVEQFRFKTLRSASSFSVEDGYLSQAQPVSFARKDGSKIYAFYYPPTNAKYCGLDGELPPLLVKSHGGPTAATTSTLEPSIQFWTSRGFAVADINYGGSSGYGRHYRLQLNNQWGVIDVQDCAEAALQLAEAGLVDKNRLLISGSSAGGYTTLCALTFTDTFAAGASYYGISDLECLAKDTHKFEAHYLDKLIGPYPQAKNLYRSRSPIRWHSKLKSPTIFFQGLEDKVVPPSQSEKMVKALRRKNLPVAYLTFNNEQHGFRQAKTIATCLNAELYFYLKIFGLETPPNLQAIEIENLPLLEKSHC